MSAWALVDDDRVVSLARGDSPPGDDWLPVARVVPDHNPATHRPTGATFAVEADRVVATHRIIPIVEPDDPPAEDQGPPQEGAAAREREAQLRKGIAQAVADLRTVQRAAADGNLTAQSTMQAVGRMAEILRHVIVLSVARDLLADEVS